MFTVQPFSKSRFPKKATASLRTDIHAADVTQRVLPPSAVQHRDLGSRTTKDKTAGSHDSVRAPGMSDGSAAIVITTHARKERHSVAAAFLPNVPRPQKATDRAVVRHVCGTNRACHSRSCHLESTVAFRLPASPVNPALASWPAAASLHGGSTAASPLPPLFPEEPSPGPRPAISPHSRGSSERPDDVYIKPWRINSFVRSSSGLCTGSVNHRTALPSRVLNLV